MMTETSGTPSQLNWTRTTRGEIMTKITAANISTETHTTWANNTTEIHMNNTNFINFTTEIWPFNVTWDFNKTEVTTMNTTSRVLDYAGNHSTAKYIFFSLSAALLILGLFGNITTLLIMQKKPFKSTCHGVYMSALAVYDSFCLVQLAFRKKSSLLVIGADLIYLNAVICKSLQFLFDAAKVGSSGLIVLICIERFVAVWLPIKAKVLLSFRTAVISVCCVSMLAIIVGVLASLCSGVEKGSCSSGAENKSLAPWVLPVISTIHSIIPSLVLVILTPLTIAKLCHVRTKRSTLGNTSNDDPTIRNAAMLITVIVVYFACVTVPSIVFIIIGSSRGKRSTPAPWMFVVFESLMTIDQVNYAVNFCLYGLTSSEFKQALKNMFRLKNQATVH